MTTLSSSLMVVPHSDGVKGFFIHVHVFFLEKVSATGSSQSRGTLNADQSQEDRREHSLLSDTMSLKMCTGWAAAGDSRRLNAFSF